MTHFKRHRILITVCRCAFGLMLVLCPVILPLQAQEAADSLAAKEQAEDWGDAEVIELEAVQIEGEIAQPNVAITVARQEPLFKEITLERTPSESLIDLDITLQGIEVLRVVKIEDWKEILEKPRK